MSTENFYISLCKKQISAQLNLENDSLVQRDFEYLNKVIFEKSGIDLSTATLRRIWSGEYENLPQAKTLDALAQVLDYDGWHEFKKANPVPKIPSNKFAIQKLSQLLVLIVLILGGITIWREWNPFNEITVRLVPEKTSHEGVPATIGFNYDISQVKDAEVMIQLSWNPYERTILDPNKNFYTGTYFYPDYHEAKLLLEEEVLASSHVHITTPGWHGLIMKSGLDINPIYVDSSDFLFGDRLAITEQLFEKYALSQLESMYSVFTFSNPALEQVDGDEFKLETTFKDLGYLFNANCRQMDVVIKGATSTIRVPISSEGCYGITTLKCSEQLLSGKTTNLSDLSTDLLQSQPIIISTSNYQLAITVGNNQPFLATYAEPIGSLKVIKFIFMGYGEVTEFALEIGGMVLEDGRLNPF